MSYLEAVKLDPRDRAAIEALLTENYSLLDHGPLDGLSALYTADATVKAPDLGLDLQGNQAIAEFFAGALKDREYATRRFWSSLRVLESGPDKVRVSVIISVYTGKRSDGTAKDFSVGDSEDVLLRGSDGQWRYAARTIFRVIV